MAEAQNISGNQATGGQSALREFFGSVAFSAYAIIGQDPQDGASTAKHVYDAVNAKVCQIKQRLG